MIKFEYPRYVSLEGHAPEMKIVMDADLTTVGNQGLAEGLGSFVLKCRYTSSDALMTTAGQIKVNPALNYHDTQPTAEVVALPGFFSINGRVDPSAITGPYMATDLATIKFDNIPNRDLVYQITIESGSPSSEMSVFMDGNGIAIDHQLGFGSSELTTVSTQELDAAVAVDDQLLLPAITFKRRSGWDYYVDATDDPSNEVNWISLPTPELAMSTTAGNGTPVTRGFLVDTLATQSTVRRFYRVRINPQVSLRFYDPDAPESTTLVDFLNLSMDSLAPLVPTTADKAIFETYSSTSTSTWADNWTANLDFSGIAWDDSKAGTLIAEQYIVYSRHWARPNGSKVRFTDRNGDIVERTIVSQNFAWFDSFAVRTDIQIARLNKPVPHTVTYYPLFPGYVDPSQLLGAKLLLTHQHRAVAMAKISQFDLFNHDSEVVTAQPDGSLIDPAWAYSVIRGDSGHPNFFVINGQLVLVSHHTFTGINAKGPYYGGIGNHEKMQRLMDEL